MSAHLLLLDGYQSEALRREADDRNLTISDYVASVLADCEIIPVATPTTEELVELALDVAEGRQVHDRARVTRWLTAEQDRLRSQLLAISTGLEVIEEPIVTMGRPTPATATTKAMGTITVDVTDDLDIDDGSHDDEADDLPADENLSPEPDPEDIGHWLDSWLPGAPTPKRRRKPGGPQVLDAADVRAIRRALATGRLTQREIAAAYGCSRSNISKILHGVSWAGVADDE